MSEQEERVNLLLRNIEDEFSAVDKLDDVARRESKLRTITGLLRDVKAVIKEYEREARVDGVPASEVLAMKQQFVGQVNVSVRRKKEADATVRAQLAAQQAAMPSTSGGDSPYGQGAFNVAAGPMSPAGQKQVKDMNNQEIVQEGRNKMDATDAELAVGRRLVAQTEETAVKTAAELKKQTGQMQTIAEDLNEIEFTMQRAGKVLRDITRGLATDKCIMCLVFLVAAAIVAAIVVKVTGVGDGVSLPGPEDSEKGSSDVRF